MNNIIEKIQNNSLIKLIKPYLNNNTYIVGGFMRDLIIGKESSDIDLVVPTNTSKILSKQLADILNAHLVTLDDQNSIYRIVFDNKKDYIDIADCEGFTIQDDLKRRDFSINAIAFDIKNNLLIDEHDGINCIKNGIIKEISEKNISDDPIRLLRAFRFQSELGFSLHRNLEKIIEINAKKISQTAAERINVELIKLFEGKNCVKALNNMDKYEILELLIPEIKDIKRIPPNSHHHLCLFDHSLEVVRQLELYYQKSPAVVKDHFEEILYAGHKRIAYLKIAAFLHDIGKPATWEIDQVTGRHRFIKHDDVGAKIVEKPLKHLKFSKKQISYIQKIIKYHLYAANIANDNLVGEKAVTRFFRKMENEVIDLIAIAYADRLAARGPDITQEMVENNINQLRFLLNKYLDIKNTLSPLPKLLTGNDIMEMFNIYPSPKLGQILKDLNEAQLSSEITTKDQAIDFVKNLLKKI